MSAAPVCLNPQRVQPVLSVWSRENSISIPTSLPGKQHAFVVVPVLLPLLLPKHSVIMVDEAHERSLATDTLLGLLKKVQRRRPDLRLIISSATLEVDRLVAFFDTSTRRGPAAAAVAAAAEADGMPSRQPAVISISGRVYPVQVCG